MAYSELIKNFDRIRDYMRQFYVYGFKAKSFTAGDVTFHFYVLDLLRDGRAFHLMNRFSPGYVLS